ncbi:hypothetical protein BDV06DRAFT_203326 [Aspergillus oleicola]
MSTCCVPTDFLQGADQLSHRLARVCGGPRLIGAIFCEFKTVEPYGDDSGMISMLLMFTKLTSEWDRDGMPLCRFRPSHLARNRSRS